VLFGDPIDVDLLFEMVCLDVDEFDKVDEFRKATRNPLVESLILGNLDDIAHVNAFQRSPKAVEIVSD
jgi:hypothetical protein